MIKMIFLLKRKQDLSREAFIERYESVHARLGEKYASEATRYVRRYLEPVPALFTGDIVEPEHDVITELWFADREQYDLAMQRLALPDVAAEIVADEEMTFDRSKNRVFIADEHESSLNNQGIIS